MKRTFMMKMMSLTWTMMMIMMMMPTEMMVTIKLQKMKTFTVLSVISTVKASR